MSLFFVFIPKFRWDDIAKKKVVESGWFGKKISRGVGHIWEVIYCLSGIPESCAAE